MTLCVTSCQFQREEFVDFTNIEAAKGLKFQVFSQRETDLSQGFPSDCYLPDGTRACEYTDENDRAQMPNGPQRTNSVGGSAILQSILKYGNQNKVIEISGSYPSYDGELNEVVLSGKVML